MGRPEKKKTENEVIKASAAIQINGKITLLQRRAWNVMLAHAYDELPSKERHSIPVQDLMHILDYNSTNQDYLKESLKALIHCSVEWNLLGDFCISPEKVHPTFPRAFVVVKIDHQDFEFIAYMETAPLWGTRVSEGLPSEPCP